MPQLNDYHVDPLLTEMSVGFANPDLIGTKLFPVLEVKSKSGIYYKFDKSSFRIEDSRRSGVTRAHRVDYGMSKQNYGPLAEHTFEEAVEWDVRDSYPTPMDAYSDATTNLTGRLDLSLEKEIATLLTTTGTITQNTTLSGTSQFSDLANSDPFSVIQTGLDTIQAAALVTANTIAMGYQVWSKLRHHPDLLGRLSVSTVRVLTEELFAAVVGVEQVFIGKAMENTAKEGQTDALSYVWGKDLIIAYVTKTPAIKSINGGYVLRLKGARVIDRWTEEAYKSDFVRVTDNYEVKLVAVEAIYLVKGAVA